jgi:hypothetical protein
MYVLLAKPFPRVLSRVEGIGHTYTSCLRFKTHPYCIFFLRCVFLQNCLNVKNNVNQRNFTFASLQILAQCNDSKLI